MGSMTVRLGGFLALLLVVSHGFALAGDDPPLRGDLGVHDPSTIIKCKDRYYQFGTGKGIISKWSTNKVYWSAGPKVFASPPSWTTNAVPRFDGTIWAPDIFFLNGQYRLYYAISSWGSQVSAIGLATNPTLDPADPSYRWTDWGPVIQSREGDAYNTIDPSVMVDANGAAWMAFGSYWTGIYLVQLNPLTGMRLAANSPLNRLAYNSSIEAACLHRHGGYYYLFVNWGSCCSGVNSTYHVRVGRSTRITGPYLDRSGVDLAQNGGTLFLEGTGKFTGPGHLGVLSEDGVESFSYHYYDAGAYAPWYGAFGQANFDLRTLSWTADGWPVFTNDWSAIYDFEADARDRNRQYYGLLRGGASITNDPVHGRVLRLNGASQYVDLPPGVAYARTFLATVKWDGGAPWQRIFDFGTDTSRYVMLTPSSGTGRLTCHIKAGGTVQALEGPSPLPAGAWTRIALTFDGRRGVLYVNGAAVATNNSLTLSPLDVRAQTNHLGHSKFAADPDFKGSIASFRAYGRVLTPAEIAAPLSPVAPAGPMNGSFHAFTASAADSSNLWNGTLVGGASLQTDAVRGRVLNLAGTGQYASLPPGAGIAQTVSAWVKWRGGAPWQRIFDFGQDTDRWFFLTPQDGDGKLQCAISTGPSSYPHVLQASAALPTNVWTHVAVTMDGQQGILYVDGQAVAVNPSVNLLPSDVGATRCYLGKSQFPADATFAGQMDSVRLDTRALALEEILAPVPVIREPAAGTRFAGGDTLTFDGVATDVRDALLAPTNLTWAVQRIQDGQAVTVLGPLAGVTNGVVPIASNGPLSTNLSYRITLAATDAAGYQRATARDLGPIVSEMRFATVPEGLQILIDGVPLTGAALPLVAGMRRTLSAPSPQQAGGADYRFVLWSDGGLQSHTMVVPPASETYTASFVLPALSLRLAAEGVEVRWPCWAGNLDLQSTASLTPPVLWERVATLPPCAGEFRVCTLPAGSRDRFFRLGAP
jgi:arabinan endo-1,5-alpha-L-arabinosidase